MRLLQTATSEIEDFICQVPEYAILSHTWGEGEVSYQELISGAGVQKKGWSKIRDCCARAAKDGWKYVWIDTCCINKESSAELSESINSMFAWYEQAAVCYAYLADVDGRSDDYNSQLYLSRWFKRGWTLQEFLAPPFLIFLDQNWAELGTRYSLRNIISPVTKIQPQQMIDFRSCNVATKFSWAALRETTRPEDQAYCLMGLFGINMPLLYGEGSKAFTRLQQKIIASNNDESIFAWEGRIL
jgi:Heterokaryon incompatibility protein (HET)